MLAFPITEAPRAALEQGDGISFGLANQGVVAELVGLAAFGGAAGTLWAGIGDWVAQPARRVASAMAPAAVCRVQGRGCLGMCVLAAWFEPLN